MKDIQPDILAVIVLVVLITCWIASLISLARSKPIAKTKSWFIAFLPLFAMLGFPAGIDLLQTGGITMMYALVVLAVLLMNVIVPILNIAQKAPSMLVADWYSWSIPFLVAGGFVVAGYLFYVEMTSTIPVCGVGIPGCATVQSSPYAKLFGFLPIAGLGLIGYIGILIAWFVAQFNQGRLSRIGYVAIWGMCMFGVLFSAYLTYLEAFVIHATCSWCISSAVLMILLLWVSTPMSQYSLFGSLDND